MTRTAETDPRLIASGTYQNGGWGTNHVSLTRKSGGYVVRDHHADGFWILGVRDAKAAFRDLVKYRGACVTLRRLAR